MLPCQEPNPAVGVDGGGAWGQTREQRIASLDQEKIDLPGNELIAEHGLRLNVLIPIYPAGKPLVDPKTHIRRKGMIR
jgi:hypothetical protein